MRSDSAAEFVALAHAQFANAVGTAPPQTLVTRFTATVKAVEAQGARLERYEIADIGPMEVTTG